MTGTKRVNAGSVNHVPLSAPPEHETRAFQSKGVPSHRLDREDPPYETV